MILEQNKHPIRADWLQARSPHQESRGNAPFHIERIVRQLTLVRRVYQIGMQNKPVATLCEHPRNPCHIACITANLSSNSGGHQEYTIKCIDSLEFSLAKIKKIPAASSKFLEGDSIITPISQEK